ncbi:hypothetical protein GFL21_08700 [Rhizobium anhuiense]|uniref:hypothetical protein n=1 Tax=Rhizobium anhuiense TaxID=1184720 RepID=UPI0014418FA5|nr:hypothetical protein [Rhizobium anhuiense]NKM54599.1 hypothetical protein [Rhizobium anhuiense]
MTTSNADADYDFIAEYGRKAIPRSFRSVAYFLISLCLLLANTYGLPKWYVSSAIGLLGLTSASARIGQVAIAVLMIMALIPVSVFARFGF